MAWNYRVSKQIVTSGGVAPISYTIVSGNTNIPASITNSPYPVTLLVDASAPANQTPGTYNVRVEAQDSASEIVYHDIPVTVFHPTSVTILTANQNLNGTIPYSLNVPLTAVGGVAPYNWQLVASDLPGLTVSAGVLSGTITQAGSGTVTLKVTDSTSGTALQATKIITIAVSAKYVTITTTDTTLQATTLPYNVSVNLTASASDAVTWSLLSSTFASNVMTSAGISNNAQFTGVISSLATGQITVRAALVSDPTFYADKTITVSVLNGLPNPVISSFTADASTVVSGGTVHLTPVYVNGSGSIDNGIGPVTSGAQVSTPPLSGSTTYTLTVTNAVGVSVTQQTTVTVGAGVAVTSFKGKKTTDTGSGTSTLTVTAGQSIILTPVFVNATSASIDNGVGAVTSGTPVTVQVGTTPTTKTFTLTVNGTGGPQTATVVVTVVAAAQISSFSANPTSLQVNAGNGANTVLTPVFSNGTGVIDQGVGSVTSGVTKTVSLTSTTTYTLTVTNAAGDSVTSAATVAVTMLAQDMDIMTGFNGAGTHSHVVTLGTLMTDIFGVLVAGSDAPTASRKNYHGTIIGGTLASYFSLADAGNASYGDFKLTYSGSEITGQLSGTLIIRASDALSRGLADFQVTLSITYVGTTVSVVVSPASYTASTHPASQQVYVTISASGGLAPYTFSVMDQLDSYTTVLPQTTLSSSQISVKLQCTQGHASSGYLAVTATDANNNVGSQNIEISIPTDVAPLTAYLTFNSLSNGSSYVTLTSATTASVSGTYNVTAQGGVAPYVGTGTNIAWSATHSRGATDQTITHTESVPVTDSSPTPQHATATNSLQYIIPAADQALYATVTFTDTPTLTLDSGGGTATATGHYSVSASGGTPQYTGIEDNVSWSQTFTRGSAATTGTHTETHTVTDGAGDSDTASASINVTIPAVDPLTGSITWGTPSVTTNADGTTCSVSGTYSVTVTGGVPGYSTISSFYPWSTTEQRPASGQANATRTYTLTAPPDVTDTRGTHAVYKLSDAVSPSYVIPAQVSDNFIANISVGTPTVTLDSNGTTATVTCLFTMTASGGKPTYSWNIEVGQGSLVDVLNTSIPSSTTYSWSKTYSRTSADQTLTEQVGWKVSDNWGTSNTPTVFSESTSIPSFVIPKLAPLALAAISDMSQKGGVGDVLTINVGANVKASGGTTPYTWSMSCSNAGVSVDSGDLSASLTVAYGVNTYSFTVTVTDAQNASVSQSFTLTVTGSGIACVPAGTLLLTPTGSVPVESVHQGDAVTAFDEGTMQKMTSTVSHVFKYENRELYQLGTSGFHTLICSGDHRLTQVSENSELIYPPARDLKQGDALLVYNDQTGAMEQTTVQKIQSLGVTDTVYHIGVEDGHVFVAGGFPAHNKVIVVTPTMG
jgi:hypothetical protein